MNIDGRTAERLTASDCQSVSAAAAPSNLSARHRMCFTQQMSAALVTSGNRRRRRRRVHGACQRRPPSARSLFEKRPSSRPVDRRKVDCRETGIPGNYAQCMASTAPWRSLGDGVYFVA